MSVTGNHEATARASRPVRAVVWVNDRETSYLRAGCGAVVLVLMTEFDGPAAMELIALLSTAYLVIAPRVPGAGDLCSWLTSVMDGLGIASAAVAAEPPFVPHLLRLGDEGDGRVRGITELAANGARFVVPLLGSEARHG